jgi:hypothetical protein
MDSRAVERASERREGEGEHHGGHRARCERRRPAGTDTEGAASLPRCLAASLPRCLAACTPHLHQPHDVLPLLLDGGHLLAQPQLGAAHARHLLVQPRALHLVRPRPVRRAGSIPSSSSWVMPTHRAHLTAPLRGRARRGGRGGACVRCARSPGHVWVRRRRRRRRRLSWAVGGGRCTGWYRSEASCSASSARASLRSSQ